LEAKDEDAVAKGTTEAAVLDLKTAVPDLK
jgi:hypothetical protein